MAVKIWGWLGIAFAVATMGRGARAQVLLRDDFNGSSLDKSKWFVGTWSLGRTQLGQMPVVAGGFARLTLETFNPRDAGRSFLGTEIETLQRFACGEGIEFESRVRVNPSPEGLVASFFTYSSRKEGDKTLSDEIDFEFLSSQTRKPPLSSTSIQLTTYRAFDNSRANYDDPTQSSTENVRVARLDLSRFNTFVIRWLPDRVEWRVNGTLVKTAISAVPEQAMNVCLNFWAPDKNWGEAFSASFLPAKSPQERRAVSYDVDYVEVRRVARSKDAPK